MAKIGLPKGSGKWLKVSEKSGNFEMDIEWQPCKYQSFINCFICLCFQSVTPDEDSILDEDSDRWNGSPQGKRLEKEWAALSQCRALKRSSEVM